MYCKYDAFKMSIQIEYLFDEPIFFPRAFLHFGGSHNERHQSDHRSSWGTLYLIGFTIRFEQRRIQNR